MISYPKILGTMFACGIVLMAFAPMFNSLVNAADIDNVDFHCVANFAPNGCNEDNSVTHTTNNVDNSTTTNFNNSTFVDCRDNSFSGLISVGCNLIEAELSLDEPPVVES